MIALCYLAASEAGQCSATLADVTLCGVGSGLLTGFGARRATMLKPNTTATSNQASSAFTFPSFGIGTRAAIALLHNDSKPDASTDREKILFIIDKNIRLGLSDPHRAKLNRRKY
jgi:hypothetical protein